MQALEQTLEQEDGRKQARIRAGKIQDVAEE